MSLEAQRSVGALRALAHPVRLRILSVITGTALSAAEIARELGLTHANASYHLRRLAGAGLVRLAEVRSIRGGHERRYVYAAERFDTIADDPVGRSLLYRALVDELLRRSLADGGSGTRTLADAELWVCPQLWTDVVRRVRDAIDDLHQGARRPASPGSVQVSATVALFGMHS